MFYKGERVFFLSEDFLSVLLKWFKADFFDERALVSEFKTMEQPFDFKKNLAETTVCFSTDDSCVSSGVFFPNFWGKVGYNEQEKKLLLLFYSVQGQPFEEDGDSGRDVMEAFYIGLEREGLKTYKDLFKKFTKRHGLTFKKG